MPRNVRTACGYSDNYEVLAVLGMAYSIPFDQPINSGTGQLRSNCSGYYADFALDLAWTVETNDATLAFGSVVS